MDFTFGIITNGINDDFLIKIINSIITENIPNYEIIIVGNTNLKNYAKVIQFDESIKTNWITKKKNIIASEAKFENIVYLHDYVILENGWYNGQMKSTNNFDVRIDKILNYNNERFRDWCLWMDDAKNFVSHNNYLIPYDFNHLTKLMYISGTYFIVKKNFILQNPLNESLSWGQGEDVEWSLRIRNKTIFNMNINSSVKLLKMKDRVFNETTKFENNSLLNITEYDNTNAYKNLVDNHLNKWLKYTYD